MKRDVEIELLTGHGHLAELLAEWHLDEWGHLYNPAVWDRATAVREFEAMAAPDKVFATFDTAWWPSVRPLRLAGQNELTAVTAMTALAGVPTLCGFAVGDAARRIEHLSTDELCRLFDRVLVETGLTTWDTPAARASDQQ